MARVSVVLRGVPGISVVLTEESVQVLTRVASCFQGAERRGMLLQYFHQTASAKVLAVKQYVMDALEAGRKFLLFAHHQEMLNPLEDAVSKVGTLLLSTLQ